MIMTIVPGALFNPESLGLYESKFFKALCLLRNIAQRVLDFIFLIDAFSDAKGLLYSLQVSGFFIS